MSYRKGGSTLEFVFVAKAGVDRGGLEFLGWSKIFSRLRLESNLSPVPRLLCVKRVRAPNVRSADWTAAVLESKGREQLSIRLQKG